MSFGKLLLAGAAALLAAGTAQAADLPLKAKAVEYVKVCSLYGAGFYYVPGTDTCIKLGGYIRGEWAFNAGGMTDTPSWNGNAGQENRLRNETFTRTRTALNVDTRTATEYGTVRTYFESVFTWSTGDAVAGGQVGVYYAFIQFAGFTIGKAVSQFSTPWNGSPGNITSNLLGGDDTSTGINQVSYTAQFDNGVSASISAEDPFNYRQAQGVASVYNVNTGLAPAAFAGTAASWFSGTATGTNNVGGVQMPEIVGQLRVDQAWGLFQLSAAGHQIRSSYYTPTLETSGHPEDKYGYAVLAALSLKNLPTGKGDTINVDATYADGAIRYVIGGTSPNNFSMYGSPAGPFAYQSVAIGSSVDGVFGAGTQIETTKAFGIRGAFNHNWSPTWSTSLFGAYSQVNYGSAGKALYCAGFGAAVPGQGATYSCDPNFSLSQVGLLVRYIPVKNLTFNAEVMYTYLDQSMSGRTSAAISPGGTKPAAIYDFKDQGTLTVGFRAQRTF